MDDVLKYQGFFLSFFFVYFVILFNASNFCGIWRGFLWLYKKFTIVLSVTFWCLLSPRDNNEKLQPIPLYVIGNATPVNPLPTVLLKQDRMQ